MSLFENSDYEWRETYFVLFDQGQLPSADQMRELLQQMGSRIEVSNVRERDGGGFESLTIVSPGDFAAMDITSTLGDEVQEQFAELIEELTPNCESAEEKKQLERIPECSARIDIYHFEQTNVPASAASGEEMEFMDPGGLLMVLDRIAEACGGIVIDPQSSCIM